MPLYFYNSSKSRDEEMVVGLASVQRDQAFSATLVHVVLDGLPVDVRVEVDETSVPGRVHVRSEVKRLSGISFSYSVEGEVLTIEANGGSGSSGSIVVRNTGNAVATDGGMANTGVVIGDGKIRGGSVRSGRSKPALGSFTLVNTLGTNWLRRVNNPKATLTLFVNRQGLKHLIER